MWVILFFGYLFGFMGLAPIDFAVFKKKMAFASDLAPNGRMYANGTVFFYPVAPFGPTFRK